MPALNDLLAPFGAALGAGAFSGQVEVEGVDPFPMQSGTPLAAFPADGHVYFNEMAKGAHAQGAPAGGDAATRCGSPPVPAPPPAH